ncbi:hypothetical protein DL89DRAFT_277355 [Linderina pennispora]|uniref:Uncharacterized protein n=1 Tax=Linderina pennispora TaxID=61395 RepID=A0A1Y1WGM8_9FUNG|nr:uncharacterized protein DL89DRAFT_277355 [Linderina pennispora]ORX72710.1 hypothetical protein DL89DRAFT_277355 [Linderina pennispora]
MSTVARPMNDEEVFSEMNKMVAFIKQEALEKAREIKVKADEEFNIEKAKLVRQESINVEEQFQRKVKQADVKQRILKLDAGEQVAFAGPAAAPVPPGHSVCRCTEGAGSRCRATQRPTRSLLVSLVTQALIQLNDTKVTVRGRATDIALIKEAVPQAVEGAKAKTGKAVEVSVAENAPLPDTVLGGMLPQLRNVLYGQSPNRKFFN